VRFQISCDDGATTPAWRPRFAREAMRRREILGG
jgi:hypothetical protein